ncbi:MAG: histidine kinase, partial [Comamonadaceae bacterium]
MRAATTSCASSRPGDAAYHRRPPTPVPMADATAPDHSEETAGSQLDDAIPDAGYGMVPLVALGGSAGAVEALQSFFRSVPPDTGLAYVVAIHLGPEHDSQLAQVLQSCTTMPVRRLDGRVEVERDRVYVLPPGKQVLTNGDALELEDLPPRNGRHVTVDVLFRTLADTHGPHSAAIVLSGTDSDGSIGIKRIKERGGLTIAQEPGECGHGGMPRSAIATGMVDWTLPVAEMGRRLQAYFQLEPHLRLPPEELPEPQEAALAEPQEEGALREILAFLRTRTGRDFTGYKRATIVRRIARRMQV